MSREPTLYDLVPLASLRARTTRAPRSSPMRGGDRPGRWDVSRKQTWGRRPTTFPIRHQSEAEYHLLQFTGPTALLDSLSHTLRIADEVLRFRIIKVVPGTPEAPASAPPVLVGAIGVPSGDGESA